MLLFGLEDNLHFMGRWIWRYQQMDYILMSERGDSTGYTRLHEIRDMLETRKYVA